MNENFATRPGNQRPQRRLHYAYSLFSASGFTKEAQEYALAHQISLVDMSASSFNWLREPIERAAGRLYRRQIRYGIAKFPVSWLRAPTSPAG